MQGVVEQSHVIVKQIEERKCDESYACYRVPRVTEDVPESVHRHPKDRR
jgi:hypothetical protein